VLPLLIVEAEPSINAGLGLGDRRIGVEVDFLVFEAAPRRWVFLLYQKGRDSRIFQNGKTRNY
jgi:hypothetical protein